MASCACQKIIKILEGPVRTITQAAHKQLLARLLSRSNQSMYLSPAGNSLWRVKYARTQSRAGNGTCSTFTSSPMSCVQQGKNQVFGCNTLVLGLGEIPYCLHAGGGLLTARGLYASAAALILTAVAVRVERSIRVPRECCMALQSLDVSPILMTERS